MVKVKAVCHIFHPGAFLRLFSYSEVMAINQYDVLILGGGLSGLSAGVALAQAGVRPLVLEQRPKAGGRAYSFYDSKSDSDIDNGQHVMLGCYRETRAYIASIGTTELTTLQPSLRIPFYHPHNGKTLFSCPNLPAPLHLAAGLLRFSALPVNERLRMLLVALHLLRSSASKEAQLDSITADAWLRRLKQSTLSRAYLWDTVTIGALNQQSDRVSALMLYRVLRTAFLGSRSDASFLLPRAGLSKVLIDPAVQFLEHAGGLVMPQHRQNC
jgi:uncharacterized protein with NAD-binding domain and iron-sulfur cluster